MDGIAAERSAPASNKHNHLIARDNHKSKSSWSNGRSNHFFGNQSTTVWMWWTSYISIGWQEGNNTRRKLVLTSRTTRIGLLGLAKNKGSASLGKTNIYLIPSFLIKILAVSLCLACIFCYPIPCPTLFWTACWGWDGLPLPFSLTLHIVGWFASCLAGAYVLSPRYIGREYWLPNPFHYPCIFFDLLVWQGGYCIISNIHGKRILGGAYYWTDLLD